MPGETYAAQPTAQPGQMATAAQPREVSDQDKKLAADWLKKIDSAQSRPAVKASYVQFERSRKLLRGVDPSASDKKLRSNLYFANLAMLRPQVYAKDPEYAVNPSKAVPSDQLELVRKFGNTAEMVLHQLLVKDCKLKKRAKRVLTGAYTTSVGWLKNAWQEHPASDPLIKNRLDDTQDNISRLEELRASLDDPQACNDTDLKIAQMREMLAGLQSQAEVKVSRGPVLDFVLSEDILIIDSSVREIGDYERAGAIAHRVWMTRDAYTEAMGYAATKAKTYTEQSGQMTAGASTASDKGADLLCVWEIWDKQSNRVLTVCVGEEGFCKPPMSPDWTGKRWYPFFVLAWNEIDGAFYPLSDVELIEPLVTEYNEQRDDFVKDRRACRPLNIARKGGVLTEEDAKRVSNREGGDLIFIEGVGNRPIGDDIWSGQLGTIDPKNYDTSASRADIEQLIGGGDASRGAVLQAKTATEAEILSQGLRGRSAERQDTLEDLLTDLGAYTLQMCLRKLSADEVKNIAGPEAVWPEMSAEQIFEQVTVEVRAGSTGRPDRLQEQDRWTKLQPVIEKTVTTVSELYSQGQVKLGQALIEMLRETLRRFDERIDLDKYLPKPPEQGQPDPAMLQQESDMLKGKVQELAGELDKMKQEIEKGYVSAAAQIAGSANPALGSAAFGQVMQYLRTIETQDPAPVMPDMQPGPAAPPSGPPQSMEQTPQQPGQDPSMQAPQSAAPIQ